MHFLPTRSFTASALVLSTATAAVAACTGVAQDRATTDQVALGATATADCAPVTGAPDDLRCTGLYDEFSTRTLAAGVLTYAPGFELWSDGAKKTRFVALPPGTKIDVRDMNAWVFPVGTRFWKEFRLPLALDGGPPGEPQLVETRMAQKTGPGQWTFATYAWSPDQSSAHRVSGGIMPVPGTESYEIPAERACMRCHSGRPDRVLGFEAALLAAPEATGLTYQALLDAGLLDAGDSAPAPVTDLQIPGDAAARDAIARLHANCGVACHHPGGPGPFSMRIDVAGGHAPATIADTGVFREAIGQASDFAPADGVGTYYRIRPTDVSRSMIYYRASVRDHDQMPPLATHRTDPALLASIGQWIESMSGAPYPAPGPIDDASPR